MTNPPEPTDTPDPVFADGVPGAAPGQVLTAAARRALIEAQARREAAHAAALPHEDGGRDGPEPTRFGDWERNGLAVDF